MPKSRKKDELSESIENVLDDIALWDAVTIALQKNWLSKYRWNKLVEQYPQLPKELMKAEKLRTKRVEAIWKLACLPKKFSDSFDKDNDYCDECWKLKEECICDNLTINMEEEAKKHDPHNCWFCRTLGIEQHSVIEEIEPPEVESIGKVWVNFDWKSAEISLEASRIISKLTFAKDEEIYHLKKNLDDVYMQNAGLDQENRMCDGYTGMVALLTALIWFVIWFFIR